MSEEQQTERPKVGVGVYVRKDGKILMQKRAGPRSPGTWAPPGGYLELFESWEECARREALEENDVEIENVCFMGATNDLYTSTHYITLHMVADWKSGEARVMEPDRSTECGWFAWEDLPKPLAKFIENFLELNINPFEQ